MNAPRAVVGISEDIVIEPVYTFGDTPTGTIPTIPPVITESVVPLAYIFTKPSDNAEDGTVPGCTPVVYILDVDIADGLDITDLIITDVLPSELQFVSITINTGVYVDYSSTY